MLYANPYIYSIISIILSFFKLFFLIGLGPISLNLGSTFEDGWGSSYKYAKMVFGQKMIENTLQSCSIMLSPF